VAIRPIDPARLSGDELLKWYQRSPSELEQQRLEAAQQKHADFVASIQEKPSEPPHDSESPLDAIADAFHDWQHGPKIARPNAAESFIPIIGPAWEAVGDLQDGNYGAAAFNGAMAIADALPVGVAVKGVRAATKGIGLVKEGRVTARAARDALEKAGLTKPGEEVHHTIPLKGTPRNVEDWRNHFPFLKSLPVEQHRRLHGSWMGRPRYDPVRQIWYGTTDWMKAIPTGVAGYVADAVENATHPSSPPRPSAPARPIAINRLPRR